MSVRIPETLKANFLADLKKARLNGTKPETVLTINKATIRNVLRVDWNGRDDMEIEAELRKLMEAEDV